MDENYVTSEQNYQAVERALSIALCEEGNTDTSMVGFGRYKTTYQVSLSQNVFIAILPVLLKYIDAGSVKKCIESAKNIALSRMVRGWGWWTICSFFLGMVCTAVHVIFGLSVFLVLMSVISVVFLNRKIVGRIWKNKCGTQEATAKAIEEMIEMCKKGRFKVFVDCFLKPKKASKKGMDMPVVHEEFSEDSVPDESASQSFYTAVSNGWLCACGRKHAAYESTCICGVTKSEAKKKNNQNN